MTITTKCNYTSSIAKKLLVAFFALGIFSTTNAATPPAQSTYNPAVNVRTIKQQRPGSKEVVTTIVATTRISRRVLEEQCNISYSYPIVVRTMQPIKNGKLFGAATTELFAKHGYGQEATLSHLRPSSAAQFTKTKIYSVVRTYQSHAINHYLSTEIKK